MIYRMSAAVLSLAGLFISAYLYLYKIGRIGTLACGTGACETVQLSPWSRFAGVEVSLIGLLGYTLLLFVSLVGLQGRFSGQRWPMDLLAGVSALGVSFTIYLTYIELFVLHAICRWCVASGLIITSIFLLAVLARRPGRQVAWTA
jgi:uncharacterized membrane protein